MEGFKIESMKKRILVSHLERANGLEAIRHVRLNPNFATLPIIALTALVMPSDQEKCLVSNFAYNPYKN
jgi:CheY-like chemotaxis protein